MLQFGIRSRLFLSCTLIVTFAIIALSAFFYQRMSDTLRERSLESSGQLLQRIESSMTQMLREMDTISAQVIYNPDFQRQFESAFDPGDDYESLSKKKMLETILSTLNGPSFIAEQINVFNLDGSFLSFGLKTDVRADVAERTRTAEWIDAAIALEGDVVLNPPHRNRWFRSEELVFSLSRLFPNNWAFSPRFVEVQQRYDKLEKMIREAERQTRQRIYVADEAGRLFYPISADMQALPFRPEDISDTPSAAPRHMTTVKDGVRHVVGWQRSDPYGLIVIATQPEAEMLAPIGSLRNGVVVVAVVAELFVLISVFLISSTITLPIRSILRFVKRWELEDLGVNRSGLSERTYRRASYEIKELYDGFVSMKERLNRSLEGELESQKRENMAHMRALQTQLQPHFVFNTLSSIGILAEKSGAAEAAEMCNKMMRMMAYISQGGTEPAELKEELRFTRDYLELMKLRYQSYFRYEVEVDPALLEKPFPKLILQPLVENSFAHGFRSVHPPWRIGIRASSLGERGWSLAIEDNGSGFAEEALRKYTGYIRELGDGAPRSPEKIGSGGIGGMGLENSLMRLYLFFGGRVSVSLRNREEGMELTVEIGERGGENDVSINDRRG